jgi:hypothetical protein
MASAKFRYVGAHAQQDLNLAPGDFVTFTEKEQQTPLVQDLITSGQLISADDHDKKKEANKA